MGQMDNLFIELKKVEPKEIMKGFHGRMLHTDNMTLVYWEIDEGSILPEHSHVHEQVVNMLEGQFELVVDGNSQVYEPGVVCMIPSYARHSGHAVTACKILDVFHPVRKDYKLLDGND